MSTVKKQSERSLKEIASFLITTDLSLFNSAHRNSRRHGDEDGHGGIIRSGSASHRFERFERLSPHRGVRTSERKQWELGRPHAYRALYAILDARSLARSLELPW